MFKRIIVFTFLQLFAISYFYDVDIPYETVNVPFKEAWFMMTSDGYRDQFGGDKDKKIMQKRLNDIIFHNESSSGDLIYDELKSQFNEWKGNKEQVDDVCVWGVKLKVD